jgi:hypothetical protein
MSDELEQRRRDVDQLLRDCIDQKVLLGGKALEKSKEAFDKANTLPALPSPWPQLAAYRLAHLQLRSAKTLQQLKKIDELLAIASTDISTSINNDPREQCHPLGPFPFLYRLAVLHRLAARARGSTKQDLKQQLEDSFGHALREIKLRLLTRLSNSEHQASRTSSEEPIQNTLFNMLELAAYFLGKTDHEYDRLQGIGALDDMVNRSTLDWFLVGPNSLISLVRLSKEVAYAELESRARDCPKAVLLRLPPHPDVPMWRRARDREWQSAREGRVEFLVHILKEPGLQVEQLMRLLQLSDSPDNYRQVLKRLRDELAELTGINRAEVLQQSQDRIAPRLHPNLIIYGVVSGSELRRRG